MMMGMAMMQIMFGDAFSPKKQQKPNEARVDTTTEAQEVMAKPESAEKE